MVGSQQYLCTQAYVILSEVLASIEMMGKDTGVKPDLGRELWVRRAGTGKDRAAPKQYSE